MTLYHLESIKINHSDIIILKDVNLNFEEGKIHALMGENGAGKTSLLEILALLEPPKAGAILFENEKVAFNGNLTKLRRKIGFCQQQPLLFNTSVFNNISFGLKIRRNGNFKERVESVSCTFGLEHLLNKSCAALSGGEAQRVALARTFVLETPVILLDEPTTNLDDAGIGILKDCLSQAKEKGRTVILATHQPDLAYKLADETITLKDQRVFPQSYQNFFSGEIERSLGLKSFKVNERVSFIVAADKHGEAKASIDPREIIISTEKFDSSARNCLEGRVVSIIDEGGIAKVTADCGVKLVSQITHRSLVELGINVGQKVYLTFKTSAVKIY